MPYPQQWVNDTVHANWMSTHHRRTQPHTTTSHLSLLHKRQNSTRMCSVQSHQSVTLSARRCQGTVITQIPVTSCIIQHKMEGMQMHNDKHFTTHTASTHTHARTQTHTHTHTVATPLRSSARQEMRQSHFLLHLDTHLAVNQSSENCSYISNSAFDTDIQVKVVIPMFHLHVKHPFFSKRHWKQS